MGRVMINGFMLIEAADLRDYEVPLWASVYLHDLSRQHDGFCEEHGGRAIDKYHVSTAIQDTLARGGLTVNQWPQVETAVTQHCYRSELDDTHKHYRLVSLLKDADALDRIRLGDLDPSFLRNAVSHRLIRFAEELYYLSDNHFDNDDPELMQKLVKTATYLLTDYDI